MGKNLRIGNKKPIKLDMKKASATLPPLPKMYQMGITKGVEQERERIIKLLEADKVERQPVCSNTDCEKCPAFERGFDRAIALIKGESNEP